MEGLFAPTGWVVQGIILITGVIGQLYVARMNRVGFYYWVVSNVVLIAVCLQVGGYGMVVLYAYFLVMAIYSLMHWRVRQQEEAKRHDQHVELLAIAKAFVEQASEDDALAARCAVELAGAKQILLETGVLADDVHRRRRYTPEECSENTVIVARTACACIDA